MHSDALRRCFWVGLFRGKSSSKAAETSRSPSYTYQEHLCRNPSAALPAHLDEGSLFLGMQRIQQLAAKLAAACASLRKRSDAMDLGCLASLDCGYAK